VRALVLGITLISATGMAPEDVVAIRDVTVISATGAPPLPGATVILRGTQIRTVGRSRETRIPSGATIIEGRGKYLIPGLIDTHVHIASEAGRPTMDLSLALELAHGVTGMRDASAAGRERAMVALRVQIDSGNVLGPRLYVSGSATPQNMGRYGASGFADLIQQLKAVGVDGIKLRNLTSAQADTAIAAARAAGLPAYGHTYGLTADVGDFTLRAVKAGAAGVMHVGGIGPAATIKPREIAATGEWRYWVENFAHWVDASAPEEERLLRTMIAHRTWLEPTLTTEAFTLHDEWYRGRPETRLIWWSTYDSARIGLPPLAKVDRELGLQAHERATRFVRRFHEAGGVVLAGTDMMPWPGAGIHEELRLLVRAGLSPMAALQAATRNAARALGWERRTGTIAPGLDADLVVLDADPLADIGNTTKIWKVIRAGHVLDRRALDLLATIPPSAGR
jgi:imidazolonepropionase-like amidohydrolase